LHIEAYHSQINNRKEKQRIKTSKEISKTKGKIKGKTVILFKERRRKHLHIINTSGLTQNSTVLNASQGKTRRKRTNNEHVSH